MASPVGHSLAGLSIYLWWSGRDAEETPAVAARWKHVAGFVILANLTDVDFLLSWIVDGNPNTAHREWTHSLVFTSIAALAAAWCWRVRPGFWRTWSICFGTIASHLVIDLFTGPQFGLSRAGHLPIAWPFSDVKIWLPVTLIVGPRHHELDQLFGLHNWLWGGYEAVLFGAMTAFVFRWRHQRPSKRVSPNALAHEDT